MPPICTSVLARTCLVLLCLAPAAHAAQIGESCVSSPDQTPTLRSSRVTEGIIQCIPDNTGHYLWQPMGAGHVRYDTSLSCDTGGMLRWTGSSIQYCTGTSWASLSGGGNGALRWSGNFRDPAFSCDAGYTLVTFTGVASNSAIYNWYECQAD